MLITKITISHFPQSIIDFFLLSFHKLTIKQILKHGLDVKNAQFTLTLQTRMNLKETTLKNYCKMAFTAHMQQSKLVFVSIHSTISLT